MKAAIISKPNKQDIINELIDLAKSRGFTVDPKDIFSSPDELFQKIESGEKYDGIFIHDVSRLSRTLAKGYDIYTRLTDEYHLPVHIPTVTTPSLNGEIRNARVDLAVRLRIESQKVSRTNLIEMEDNCMTVYALFYGGDTVFGHFATRDAANAAANNLIRRVVGEVREFSWNNTQELVSYLNALTGTSG